jgi:hypothetical protein
MNTNSSDSFSRFSEAIKSLPSYGLTLERLEGFVLEQSERFRIYYAPFDSINTSARVVVVGITPGQDSMLNSFREAAAALRDGATLEEASRRAKCAGSFSNMRGEMAAMFDELGLAKALGISQSSELFAGRNDLLHATSCLRYPVLVWKKNKWENYSGHSPKLLRWDRSLHYIQELLARELRQIPRALVVPCGEAVTAVLRELSRKQVIDEACCLFGFPHASKANGHRKKHFENRKEQLREIVARWNRDYSL